MLPAETVAISIGDGHSGASILLPRGHQLVKTLEALIVPTAVSPAAHVTRPDLLHKRADANSTRTLPALPRHLFQHSPSSVGAFPGPVPRPASPYLSDSSHSSSSAGSGVRRRRPGVPAAANGKKCQFEDCDKISVSRGLCRGHGGGRRCQHAGCAKGAQSRSDFCWSHGGGQRCDVPNCMRSRKTKRFCVAHRNWELAAQGVPLPAGEMTPRILEASPKRLLPRAATAGSAAIVPEVQRPCMAKLPSLQQALLRQQCVPVAPPTAPMDFSSSFGPILNRA